MSRLKPSARMILVAGSANLDFVVRAAHIPAPGETVLGQDLQTFPGGKGANQAIACARAGGAATAMLLALGDDAYAEPITASLTAAGVRQHVIRTPGTPTGTAFICVAASAENAITVAPGANRMLRANDLPSLQGITHLLLQLEIPVATVLDFARAARAAGVAVILNAAPAAALPSELLTLIDLLIVNEGELAAIAPQGRDTDARLRALPVPNVVVTLGQRGCRARVGDQLFTQDAYAVTAVDTTAAGDVFVGVLTAELAQRVAWPEALRTASAAAALACTRIGAQSSVPTRVEVDALLRERHGAPSVA